MKIPKIKDENFNKRFFIILADRQKYRFFTIYLGDFQQSEEMLRENVPKSIRHDLGRHGKTGRHIRKHLEEHLKKVGQKAEEFLDKNKILHLDGLVLCSHSELFFDIKKNLPVFLRKKIIGEVILTPDVSLSKATSEIIKKLDL